MGNDAEDFYGPLILNPDGTTERRRPYPGEDVINWRDLPEAPVTIYDLADGPVVVIADDEESPA